MALLMSVRSCTGHTDGRAHRNELACRHAVRAALLQHTFKRRQPAPVHPLLNEKSSAHFAHPPLPAQQQRGTASPMRYCVLGVVDFAGRLGLGDAGQPCCQHNSRSASGRFAHRVQGASFLPASARSVVFAKREIQSLQLLLIEWDRDIYRAQNHSSNQNVINRMNGSAFGSCSANCSGCPKRS